MRAPRLPVHSTGASRGTGSQRKGRRGNERRQTAEAPDREGHTTHVVGRSSGSGPAGPAFPAITPVASGPAAGDPRHVPITAARPRWNLTTLPIFARAAARDGPGTDNGRSVNHSARIVNTAAPYAPVPRRYPCCAKGPSDSHCRLRARGPPCQALPDPNTRCPRANAKNEMGDRTPPAPVPRWDIHAPQGMDGGASLLTGHCPEAIPSSSPR